MKRITIQFNKLFDFKIISKLIRLLSGINIIYTCIEKV